MWLSCILLGNYRIITVLYRLPLIVVGGKVISPLRRNIARTLYYYYRSHAHSNQTGVLCLPKTCNVNPHLVHFCD